MADVLGLGAHILNSAVDRGDADILFVTLTDNDVARTPVFRSMPLPNEPDTSYPTSIINNFVTFTRPVKSISAYSQDSSGRDVYDAIMRDGSTRLHMFDSFVITTTARYMGGGIYGSMSSNGMAMNLRMYISNQGANGQRVSAFNEAPTYALIVFYE